MFNNYYATSAPTYPISISIAWFLGLSAVFGCLLGFLFGFRSAFTDKQASVTSSLPTAKLRVAGTSSRSIRIFSRRTAMIVFAGLAVAVVGGNLLWWTLLHRPYIYHSDSSSVGNISWSPSGKYLAFTTSTNPAGSSTSTVQTSTLRVLDVATNENLSLYTSTYTRSGSHSAYAYWSPDSQYLAFTISTDSGGSSTSTVQKGTVQVWVWDAITKANLFIYTYPYTYPSTGSSSPSFGSSSSSHPDITWSTDDKHLAFVINNIDPSCETTSNSCNGTVHIWDATTKGSTYVLRLGSSAVEAIAWSPDDTRIASGSSDGTLYVWYAV